MKTQRCVNVVNVVNESPNWIRKKWTKKARDFVSRAWKLLDKSYFTSFPTRIYQKMIIL